MATLTTQTIAATGSIPTYAAASAGGDALYGGPGVFAHVKNGAGAGITVTVAAKQRCNFGTLHDLAVTVPANSERMIPVPSVPYTDSDGLAWLSYSAVTSVTVAAVQR